MEVRNRKVGGLETKPIIKGSKTTTTQSEFFSIAPPSFDVESYYSFCEFYNACNQASDRRRVAEASFESAPEAVLTVPTSEFAQECADFPGGVRDLPREDSDIAAS